MSYIERILTAFNPDGSVRGIAAYGPDGMARESTIEEIEAAFPVAGFAARAAALAAQIAALQEQVAAITAERDQVIQVRDRLLAEAATAPMVVTMAQARVALKQAGLFDQIDAFINALPEPPRITAMTAWEYSPTVSRQGALVNMLSGQFGFTEEQLDDLFAAAAAIEL